MTTFKYLDQTKKQLQEDTERKKLAELLRKNDIDPNGVFYKLHNQWVVTHRGLERLAMALNIKFDLPIILESDSQNFSVALLVKGKLDDKEEWTIGEANIKNIKIPFPYAIAEKRAKDRIILKLLGAHGFVYSDSEIEGAKDGDLS